MFLLLSEYNALFFLSLSEANLSLQLAGSAQTIVLDSAAMNESRVTETHQTKSRFFRWSLAWPNILFEELRGFLKV
jgi:hypothetical protein